ncbi:MAG TPA: LysM domain-containing protein [Patescibacteria group bacterium]
MDPRTANWIFGVITVGALAFAGITYVNKSNSQLPQPTISVVPTGSSSPQTSATMSPKATATPVPSASPANSRKFTTSQGLSLPNEVETIGTGGSLSTIAGEHNMTATELAQLNGIADANTIYAGQTIIIPDDIDTGTYTILYILNTTRLTKEKSKIESGASSLYSESVTAAQTDLKGIFSLKADSPFSKSNETEKNVTLSTTSEDKIFTATMEKHESGLWIVKKLVVKETKATP